MTRFCVRHPIPVVMAVLALVLMGAVAHSYLKVDRLPPLSYPTITITTRYPQAAALDVEQLVTEVIEDAVAGAEGVESISSTSREGRSTVRVQLVEGSDPDTAALEIERRIARIRSRLPVDAIDPTIAKADPNELPVMNVAITGAPLDELYDIATTQIEPALQSVLGVASVTTTGGLQREWQVVVNYSRLAAYNLSVQQLANALVAANVTSTIGSVDQGIQQLDVRAVGAFQTQDDLERIVIAQQPAGPVLLKDVATVREGYKDRLQLQRLNGNDAVGFSIVKSSSANALQVTEDVRKTMESLKTALPAGASYVITNDSSKYTRAALDAVQSDLILAIFLVAAVVLLFLHAWRNVLIIVLAIPTSMVATFFVMYALGFSLNLMTLMALALTVGILVDDATVVLENIHRHLHLGEDPQTAAINGRNEIGLAALAITAADVVVYTPIAFMSGIVGQLFRQYGLTVVAATLFSLAVSFTLTPMLGARWMRRRERGITARLGAIWDAGFDRVAAAAQAAVPVAVRGRWLVVLVSATLVTSSVVLVQQRIVGSEYAPGEDSDTFSVNVQTPPGTSLLGTDDVARRLEAALMRMPEVQDIFTSVSIGGAGFNSGTGGTARLQVQLTPKKERERSVFDIVQEVRQLGRRIPGARIVPSVPSSLPGGGGSSGLDFVVSGPDIDVLRQVVNELEAAAATVPGLADVQDDGEAGSPTVEIRFDSALMAQLGVTTQQAVSALRTTVGGQVVTQLRRPGKVQQDITVIAADVDRKDLNKLAAIPIKGTVPTANGNTAPSPTALVTLGQVATIAPGTGPVQIQRLNRNRTITVTGTAVGRSLGDVAADLRVALASVPLPPGYTVVPGRQINRFNDALASLLQAIALALLLEYMLLAALYESLLYPFVLILSVPLGLVGSMFGLLVTGNTINIFSMMGLIMAFGLVAKNGILLVDFTNQLRRRGTPRTEALALAARTRLRPILMTSATMLFGMLPLTFKAESGAESRAPMAVVVIGALITSTALATIVLPAVYTLVDDLQGLVTRVGAAWAARFAEPAPAPAEAYPEALPANGLATATDRSVTTPGTPAQTPTTSSEPSAVARITAASSQPSLPER